MAVQKLALYSVVISLLALQVDSLCYNYWKGQFLPNYQDPSSYCQNIITWQVSDAVIADSAQRDTKALSYYEDIYNNQYLNGSVTTDCLGVLRFMACAATYPTCNNYTDSIPVVCDWLCNLMSIRCGTQSQLYLDACVNGQVSTTKCSYSSFAAIGAILLLILLTLI